MLKDKKIQNILSKKERGEKITMLTAYDYPLASLIDQAGIDIVLVGDSLANVVLGLESTKEVGMNEMIHHAKAVCRAVKNALVIGDMPFVAYHDHPQEAVRNAKRFIEEAGCGAVKLEWFDQCVETTQKIIQSGIPVMGHIGLTPQTADQLGGLKVQGREVKSAKKLVEESIALQVAGCFAIVLECIPDKLAQLITKQLRIPTIGIGGGVHCDGQVLVTYDLLGLFDGYHPKFVKQYANLSSLISQAVLQYKKEVQSGQFPDEAHSFKISPEELDQLKKQLGIK